MQLAPPSDASAQASPPPPPSPTAAPTAGLEAFVIAAAPVVLRWMLGLTLLSAVADRFGFWGEYGTPNASWGDWAHFLAYNAKVNSFAPASVVPILGIVATAAETLLGFALLLGVFPRATAAASAILFATFAGAMTLSFGIKAPLNFSVFVDAGAALLLWAWLAKTSQIIPLPKTHA